MGTPQLTARPFGSYQIEQGPIGPISGAIGQGLGGALMSPGQAIAVDNQAYYNLLYTDNTATNGWSTTTGTTSTDTITTTGDMFIQGQVYANGFQNWAQKAYGKVMKFFRVNELVTMPEGGELTDPLDALRLKVQRWLKNPDV